MDKVNRETHQFAFYLKNLSFIAKQLTVDDKLKIEDKDLIHRLLHVVRLEKGDTFTLFDRTIHLILQCSDIYKKKYIATRILQKKENSTITPKITFLLPLLKKENFEHALYSLAELGAHVIQPIITQKSQKAYKVGKSYDRFLKIITSAAEQSKHFAFPVLKEPIEMQDCVSSLDNESVNIFFDAEGKKVSEVIKTVEKKSFTNINLMIGPEGDLTEEEKGIIRDNKFIYCKLTPTILRACQATAVGLGLFRSLLYD